MEIFVIMTEYELEMIFEEWIENELQASACGYPGSFTDSEIYNIMDICKEGPYTMEEILKYYKIIK